MQIVRKIRAMLYTDEWLISSTLNLHSARLDVTTSIL